STPARARRPTTARTGARPNRRVPAAAAGASVAGPGDRAADRPRAAARAGRPSLDGSPLDLGSPAAGGIDLTRAPRPDDLYRLRIATEPRLSPDGQHVAMTLQTVAPGFDGYRHALWLVPTEDGDAPRQLTIGARHDRQPRFSPDGRTLAFISDRRLLVEEEPSRSRDRDRGGGGDARPEREDREQIHLLPLAGGEARR